MKRILMFSSFFGLIVFLAVGCGSPSPSTVAERFYDALAKGDMETVGKYSTDETVSDLAPLISKVQPVVAAYGKGKAVSQDIDGDEAVVVMKFANQEDTEEVNLVKVNGKWKIDETLNSSSGSGK
jgi:hypothetical protein